MYESRLCKLKISLPSEGVFGYFYQPRRSVNLEIWIREMARFYAKVFELRDEAQKHHPITRMQF